MIGRVLYHDVRGPYTVATVLPAHGEPVTVVGRFPEVRPGEHVRASGTWRTHPRFGRQLRADELTLVLPATADGIRRYLASPLVGGIGPVTATRLVERFGEGTLAALDEGEATLRTVAGIGPLRARQIARSWEEHRAERDVLLLLFGFGLSYRRAEQIRQRYGNQAALVVRSDPYRLVVDIRGIGFRRADRLAAAAGLPPTAPSRLQAAVLHTLRAAARAGHTWVPTEQLLFDVQALLKGEPDERGEGSTTPVDDAPLTGALETLAREGAIEAEELDGQPAVALVALATLERSLARDLRRLSDEPGDRLATWGALTADEWAERFAALPSSTPLSEEQRAAVRMALTSRVALLTGGPGTGKTTTLRALVTLARTAGGRVLLAAPTGRAARRLEEATGVQARTIHRLLRLGHSGRALDDNWSDPLELEGLSDTPTAPGRGEKQRALLADLVVVDEASMLDLALARAVVRAVARGAHLLLVGDADQLPSIGPGQVLADLIAAGAFPVARLERIYRQGEGSGIAANARRINAGEMPVWEPGLGTHDFYLFNAEEVGAARDLVLDLVARRIPQRFGLAGAAVQVLAPMYRGPVGLTTLNPELQRVLNPPAPDRAELLVGTRLLRLGDRVVQTRNNYDLGVFNGDMGVVAALDPEAYAAVVRLDDGREVAYEAAALAELHLAYAVSVHRAQGSEFPAVVLPVVTGQFILLSRRLLYTAVTRAQRLVVLVGHSRAISFAVRDAASERRLTRLVSRLGDSTVVAPPSAGRPRRGRPVQPPLI